MKTLRTPVKLLALPFLLGFISAQSHALPYAPGIAYAPYHIKPNTPTIAPSGLSPAQVRKAYGFGDNDWQGSGQVIAIVDAYDDPNIESDLNVFSNTFGLPSCTTANGCFKKVYATGKKPKKNAGWCGEISLDVEWVHAMAPQAKIILVEAANDSMNSLMQGVQAAIKQGAHVVSMSWGGAEFSTETEFDSMFNVAGVTFTAASGDSGAGVIYPAASPNVLAAGGTTLSLDANGNYAGETAWSGSGGGVSAYETIPDYQSGLPIPNNPNKKRGVPDVSYNADPNSGFSVYDSVPYQGQKGWLVIGGTSAAAPQWAALIADVNSGLGKSLDGTNGLIYSVGKSNYSNDYHDVESGSNGSCGYYCDARTGYDYVTGLGSPHAPNLMSDLMNGKFGKIKLS